MEKDAEEYKKTEPLENKKFTNQNESISNCVREAGKFCATFFFLSFSFTCRPVPSPTLYRIATKTIGDCE